MTDTAAQNGTADAKAAPDTMAWDSGLRRLMMIYLPLAASC